jgi:transposase
MKKIVYVGVDYHVKTITCAVIIEGEKDFLNTIRFKNNHKNIKKYMKKLSETYDIRTCYEASCNGYSFQRRMRSWGYHCDVIAPSLVPKKPGDRRKNDFRDARTLAQHYAQGMLAVVHPPTEQEESVRGVIRCRLAMKKNGKSVKQQINPLLLTQDLHWSKTKWTDQHRAWLSKLKLRDEYSQQVLDELLGLLGYLDSRIQYLDKQIEEIASSEVYAPSVKKLKAFKGIKTLTAMLLIAEITDFRRFPNPKALMAFLGLIPSEDTSDDNQKGGSITKAGNSRCRLQLIESVIHYIKKPVISTQMQKDLKEVDSHSANIAIKCMKRLHKRYWSLVLKGKNSNKAKTAIAREFVGFIWAMMQPEPATI